MLFLSGYSQDFLSVFSFEKSDRGISWHGFWGGGSFCLEFARLPGSVGTHLSTNVGHFQPSFFSLFLQPPPRSPSGTAMALSVRTFLHHLAGPRVSVHFCFQPVFPPRPAALGLSGLSESTASLPGQLQNAIEPVQCGWIFVFFFKSYF